MKFICYVNDMRNALKFAVKCAAVKPMTPILAATKLVAEGGKLTLYTTNFKVAAQIAIPIVTEENGTCAVGAQILTEVVNKFDSNSTISFDDASGMLNVSSEGTSFNLLSFNADDFPKNRFDFGDNEVVKIRAEAFKSLIRHSLFATSKSEDHPVFGGVNFKVEGNYLVATATNSNQLARAKEGTAAGSDAQNFDVIVPVTALKILEPELSTDYNNLLTISTNGQLFYAQADNYIFCAQLIDGTFPDTLPLFQQEKRLSATFNTAEFRNAVKQLSVISKQNEYSTIHIAVQSDKAVISAVNEYIGNAEKVIEADAPEDADFVSAYNFAYLLGFLNAAESKEILARFNDKYDPAIFSEVDNPNFDYVVTPVRT